MERGRKPFWRGLGCLANGASVMARFQRWMILIGIVSTFLSAALFAGADSRHERQPNSRRHDNAMDRERKRIEGVWTIDSIGDGVHGELFRTLHQAVVGTRLTIKNYRIIVKGGDFDRPILFQIDPTREPKHIDLVIGKEITYYGVYTLDGDTLRVYFAGKQRPNKVQLRRDASDQLFFVLKREKHEKLEK